MPVGGGSTASHTSCVGLAHALGFPEAKELGRGGQVAPCLLQGPSACQHSGPVGSGPLMLTCYGDLFPLMV